MSDQSKDIDLAMARARKSKGPLPPLPVARLVHKEFDGLVRWQNSWWTWGAGAYRQASDESVRAVVYDLLESLGQTPTRTRVSDALDALRAVALVDNELEPPVWLSSGEPLERGRVAVANGILDLVTGEIEDATPDLLTLSALPVTYDPLAACPSWQSFLCELWPDDPESIQLLQEWFGYLISGETDHHKILLLVGPRRAGKGTIMRVITALLGRRNVAAPTLSSLAGPFGLEPLIGRLAALISDARLGGRADQDAVAERLLNISGGDLVGIHRKYASEYTAQLQTRIIIATNELPRVQDISGALASRFLPLVLSRSWLGHEDRGVGDRLLAELPGILNWALVGWRRLRERGAFHQPRSAADAMAELEDLGSPVGAFVRGNCAIEPGAEVSCGTLYHSWCEWCSEHGRRHPGTEGTFGRDLRAVVPGLTAAQVRRGGVRVRVYKGLRLAGVDDGVADDDLL